MSTPIISITINIFKKLSPSNYMIDLYEINTTDKMKKCLRFYCLFGQDIIHAH